MRTARALDKEYNQVVHTGKSERPTPLISLSKARSGDNPFLGTRIPPHIPKSGHRFSEKIMRKQTW